MLPLIDTRSLGRFALQTENIRISLLRIAPLVPTGNPANVELAIEVTTALYKTGVLLLIHDAEKLLRILREEDYVRLIPNSYHNYMGYQEEGTVYELPWEYECSDDGESVLTLEQYNSIVSLAEWQDEELVNPVA